MTITLARYIKLDVLFSRILQKKINLSSEDNLRHKGLNLIKHFGFNQRTDFYKEYKSISKDDMVEYNLPDIDLEEYQDVLKNYSWFDILNIKHGYYSTINKAKDGLKKYNIVVKNAKSNWENWGKIDPKLPPYPIYVWDFWNESKYIEFEAQDVNPFL